jgi:hypothetical protein
MPGRASIRPAIPAGRCDDGISPANELVWSSATRRACLDQAQRQVGLPRT